MKGWTISENTSYKIVALLITLILWIIIMGSKEAVIVKSVPITYLVPQETVLVGKVPQEVAFKISGPRLMLNRFSAMQEPLTVDLTASREGRSTVRIHPDGLNTPPSLRVLSVSPTYVPIKLEKVITKIVPVKVITQGSLPKGRRLRKMVLDPENIGVSGPRSVLRSVNYIPTQPLDLTQINETTTVSLGLVLNKADLVKEGPEQVQVRMIVK